MGGGNSKERNRSPGKAPLPAGPLSLMPMHLASLYSVPRISAQQAISKKILFSIARGAYAMQLLFVPFYYILSMNAV